jgi:hypothetical protein
MDLPQNTGTQGQTVKIPISPIQANCSGFCSGFKGDASIFRRHFPTQLEGRILQEQLIPLMFLK